MVAVPKYNVPEVTPSNIPQADFHYQTDPEMFGGGTAQGLGKIGQAGEQVATKYA